MNFSLDKVIVIVVKDVKNVNVYIYLYSYVLCTKDRCCCVAENIQYVAPSTSLNLVGVKVSFILISLVKSVG